MSMQPAGPPPSSARAREAPLHAVTTSLAAATLAAATLADLAGVALDRATLWVLGAYLVTAGIVVAALAVVPGVSAHRRRPPSSPGRRRSLRRGLIAAVAIVLFALARWVRGHPEVAPDPPIVGAECLAAVLLVLAWRGARRARLRDRGVPRA